MEQYPYRCAVCRQSLSLGGIISYDIKFNYLYQELRKAAEQGKVEYMNLVKLTGEEGNLASPSRIGDPKTSSLLKRRNLNQQILPVSESSIVDEVLAKSRMSLSSLGRKKPRHEEIYSPLEMVKSKSRLSHKRRGKQSPPKDPLGLEILTPTEFSSQTRITKPMTTDDIDDLEEELPALSLFKHSSLQTYDRSRKTESTTAFPVIDELSDTSD